MPSDQELIKLINQGDSNAFETLYLRYRDWVFNLAWRFTANHEDSGDVLQETFSYLLRKFPGFTLTANLKTFLYPVVKHLAINIQTKNKRFTGNEQLLDSLPAATETIIDEARTELARGLKKLSDQQKEIVLLRFVDNFSLEEIAQTLDIAIGTVKSRLHRALETLRNDPNTKKYFKK